MMPAATHFDPVVGIDIHMVQPSGPVPPVPIPHPYIGIVFDPFDYLPIIGSTVKVNGLHRAIAGTAGKALPRHFPIGGTFVPPLPADEHENFMGSSTVEMDGDAAAYMALPCLSCQSIGMPPPLRRNPKKKTRIESLVLPTSLVLPIPKGAPVLIGGAPTISLTNVAFHLLAPLARAIKRSKPFRKGAEALGKARRRPFRNMKPGFLKCRILRAEPVDVVTGEVVVDQQDFELPGRIPIRWTRHCRSGSARRGICGVGWETPADARLELGDDGVVFHDGAGVATFFDALPDAEPVVEPVDGGRLHRLDRHFVVEQKGGLSWYFEIPHTSAAEIRVSAIVDRCRNALHFLRDGDGLREVVESAGRRLVCASERGLLRRITLHHPDFPERTLVRFAYDDADNLTAVHDALDHPYTFGWDDRHRLVRHTNRTGLSFHYEYDADSRCVHSWGDGGLHDYHFAYDPVARFTNLTDSLGHPWTVDYDERLLITRETDPLGGVTSYTYDEVGRTVAVVDPAGRMTAYAYDERGNLVELTRPDGKTIVSEFDRDNRPIRITDPNGAVWEHRWDERGLLVERRSPLGASSRYSYDPGGQLTCVADPRGAAIRVELDAFGNLAVLADALGSVTRFRHDALGNVTTQVDPLGCTTVYEYDAKGQLAKVLLPTGAAISCAYDPRGELTRYMDENGAVTLLAFAGQGRIRRRVRPDGSRVEYHYDSEERLIGVTNERGETYRLEHDALGRIVKETDYWGQVRLYTYDAAGHLRQSVDPLGRVIRYATDPLGRVRRKVLPHPEQPDATFEETYDFDANGHLVRAANPYITITRRFDAEGRLLEEVQGDFAVRNTYDPNGNRVGRETSAGNSTVFEYDALDHVCAIHINGEPPILIQRDRRGQIIGEAFGRGLVRRYGYDAIGRQTEQAVARSGEALFAVGFDYDAAGNLTRRSDSRHGSDRYRYDPLGRVMDHADSRGRLARFLHDPSGDRLVTKVSERDAPPGVVAAETDSSVDRWAREGAYDGRSYRFDRAGNLVLRSSGTSPGRPPTEAVTTGFTWDANQRLLRSETNGICTRYGYDPLGRRLFKETDGRRTSFYWDGDALAAEDARDVSEPAAGEAERFARVREYLYYPATFSPLALIDKSPSRSRVYHYHADPNGCPTRLTDETGEVAWSAAYGVWGTVTAVHAAELSNPIRLQGQYEDPETSLHYNRHRYFDHAIGQFVGQDPLRLRPGDNIYEFGPNAFQWADPLGLAQHRVVYWWERPSTGEWDIGREFSGLNPGHKRKLSYVEQTDTHTEHLILRGLEDRIQPGDIITIMGTEPPCGRPRNGRRAMTEWCYDRMEGFADWHDVEIRYIVPRTGSMWRFRRQPPSDCGR